VRLGDRLRGRHRDNLRLARHGQAAHRLDQRARPAGDRRLPVHRRGAVRRDQSRGRPCDRLARPARAPGSGTVRAALALLVLLALAAALAPWIAPQNPYDLAQLQLIDSRLPPLAHTSGGAIRWLGTDDQGRDMLSAILFGLRTSLA